MFVGNDVSLKVQDTVLFCFFFPECSAGLASASRCQTECPGSPASVARAAGSLIQMTAATSVEKRVTTHTTVIATAREVADAAGMPVPSETFKHASSEMSVQR